MGSSGHPFVHQSASMAPDDGTAGPFIAGSGHAVLMEGLLLSGEYDRSAALAEAHQLHVLRLDTSLERCVRNLIARRHARRDTWPLIARTGGSAGRGGRGSLWQTAPERRL